MRTKNNANKDYTMRQSCNALGDKNNAQLRKTRMNQDQQRALKFILLTAIIKIQAGRVIANNPQPKPHLQ